MLLIDDNQFGVDQHHGLLSYLVEKDGSFAIVAAAFDGEHFALAEFGVAHPHTYLYGVNFSSGVGSRRALGQRRLGLQPARLLGLGGCLALKIPLGFGRPLHPFHALEGFG